jgi:thioesterase domain-containing protein
LESNDTLLAYLQDHIPLTKALGLQVLESGPTVVLQAPLSLNINHMRTAFGGSLFSVAVLTGWSWIHVQMQEAEITGQIMIVHSAMDYREPVAADFTARCEGTSQDEWNRAIHIFKRRGKARVILDVIVEVSASQAATFHGEYVIVR